LVVPGALPRPRIGLTDRFDGRVHACQSFRSKGLDVDGSASEPVDHEDVVAQMRDATDRLREQAWMVAPLAPAQLDRIDADLT
jgi:hypothetical protein